MKYKNNTIKTNFVYTYAYIPLLTPHHRHIMTHYLYKCTHIIYSVGICNNLREKNCFSSNHFHGLTFFYIQSDSF